MQIFTIKIDNQEDSRKLEKVLVTLHSAKVSLIDENDSDSKGLFPLEELKERIKKSKETVANGKFITQGEFEKISGKWLQEND